MINISRKEVVNILTELVRIPSVNPNLTEDKGQNEMQLARFVLNWLQERNIFAQLEEVEPGRPNVFAEIGEGQGKTLCLCAHLDTVGVKEMQIPPFEPKLENNKLFGRGSCDMKGGLAAILSAAALLKKEGFQGRVILALVCDEEYASIGADAFVKRHRADACILTEPSDLNMVIAHKGFLWGKIKTSGTSAHGSRWDLGESAISKAGPILVELDRFDKETLRRRKEPHVGPASMHVSLINGGAGISTYASSCTLHLERRTLPSEKMEDVQKETEEVIFRGCPNAEVEWYFQRPPFFCDPNETIADSVRQSFHKVIGREIKEVGWGVWTDAAIFQEAGIPTVNIGPTGFGLHEPVEWVDVDSVVDTAKILYQAAHHFFLEHAPSPNTTKRTPRTLRTPI